MGRKLSGTGYRRPPKERCWSKGQSGNLEGRPPGHRNLVAALTAVLHETVSVEDQPNTQLFLRTIHL